MSSQTLTLPCLVVVCFLPCPALVFYNGCTTAVSSLISTLHPFISSSGYMGKKQFETVHSSMLSHL
jgi:hypothetical protein